MYYVKKTDIQGSYSHCPFRINAFNHSSYIAEAIPAQVLASFDQLFHALTPDNNATLYEEEVYTSFTNRRFAFCDPGNAR
jgi:hypothetical protein